jgi:hypothetical protein
MTQRPSAVDLYWIPLGAGGHCVRFNGLVYEAISAACRHRPRCDLYHAALVVELDGDRHTIEIAPSPNADEASRGVVATGAVGSRYAGRLRLLDFPRFGGHGVSRRRWSSLSRSSQSVGGDFSRTARARSSRASSVVGVG